MYRNLVTFQIFNLNLLIFFTKKIKFVTKNFKFSHQFFFLVELIANNGHQKETWVLIERSCQVPLVFTQSQNETPILSKDYCIYDAVLLALPTKARIMCLDSL